MMKRNRNISVLLLIITPIVFFFVGLFNMDAYGETTDEKDCQHIGEFYYNNWKKVGIEGLNSRFSTLQRNYGPLFYYVINASYDLLNVKYKIIDNPVSAYHFPVLVVSSLLIFSVSWFGYKNFGLTAGIISGLALALMPRFIGDSQNNLKDTPMTLFFTLTVVTLFSAIRTNKIGLFALGGVLLGLSYTVKFNALMTFPVISLWWLLTSCKENSVTFKSLLRLSRNLVIALTFAYGAILIFWPYYRYQPLSRFQETFKIFSVHEWNDYVLFLGQHYRGQELPAYYPWVMFGVTTPPVLLILTLLGLFLAVYFFLYKKFTLIHQSTLLLLFLWFIIPPAIQAYSKTPMYDGIRHFLTSLPAMALIIGYTASWLIKKFQIKPVIVMMLVGITSAHLLWVNHKIHPYQIVYFNSLTGGVNGAYGQYDLEYWGQSLNEASEWMTNNLPKGSRIWLVVPMYHPIYTTGSEFVYVGKNDRPDYKLVIIRGMAKNADAEDNYLNPKDDPIYSINVDGGDILRIFKLDNE